MLIDHLALWLTLVPVVMVAFRVWRESNGDLALAQFLMQYSSPLTLALGTLLPYVAPFALISGWVLVTSREGIAPIGQVKPRLVPVVGYSLFMSGAYLSPLWLVCAVVGWSLGVAIFRQARQRWFPTRLRLSRKSLRVLTTDLSTVVAVVAVTLVLFPKGMWVPQESIELANGTTLSGFVMGQSGDFLAVLTDDPRAPRYVKTTDVLTRTVCGDAGRGASLASLMFNSWESAPMSAC